jgi:3-oxoacyl-[acyl-carrier protein] reductase
MTWLEDRLGLGGKVAIIAGGGGGLGRASAYDLARAGVSLALLDKNEQFLSETIKTIEEIGAPVVGEVVDATDPVELARFFTKVDAIYGSLDILVNAVGAPFPEEFITSDGSDWQANINSNYTWCAQSMRLASERMRTRGGSIINFTTIEAHRSAPGNAVYAGAKAGLVHLSRTLGVELAPYGIRVNTIAPDMTLTERPRLVSFLEHPDTEQGRVGARFAVPLGRLGKYDDIGGCVLFLASDLSKYITGQTLHADGGTFASSGWYNWPGTGGYGTSGFLPIPPQEVMDFLSPR